MADPSQLLASLASGVRPVDLPERPSAAPIEAWDFDALLHAVRKGEIASGHRLRLVGGDEDFELSESRSLRLAETADAAEAGGLSRVAAIIDGFAVDLDVAERTIGRALRIAPESATSTMRAPFDGVIVVSNPPPQPLVGPSGLRQGLAPGVLGVVGALE